MKPREPSGPIQVPVPGLLGLLQLKNAGANPAVMLDEVQPGFDMLQFWLQNNQETTTFVPGVPFGPGGRFQPAFGPFDEPRWIHNFSVLAPLGAGDDISNFGLTYITQRVVGVSDGIHHFIENGTQNFGSGALVGPNAALMIGVQRFWLSQGDSLGCLSYSNGAGSSWTPTFSLRSTPVPA